MITLADLLSAQSRLQGITVRTPLIELPRNMWGQPPSGACPERANATERVQPGEDRQLFLKPENQQPIGAFKLRGAYNKIASLSEKDRARGVISYSSGNHAQGVAYAARALGVKAVIVMPNNAPQIKREATANLGAEIVLVGPGSDERKAKAEELAAHHGYAIVPPYNDEKIIAGQGTIGLEILEDLTDLVSSKPAPIKSNSVIPSGSRACSEQPNRREGVEWEPVFKRCHSEPAPSAGEEPASVFPSPAEPEVTILSPVGGGGLISGVAAAVKLTNPKIKVIGVEPELAADAQASLRAGKIVQFPAEQVSRTLADGLRTQSVGPINFEHIRAYVDDIITVTEDEIRAAMKLLAANPQTIAEPSGAVATAGFLFHRHQLPATQLNVAIISGGNIEPQMLAELRSK
jgi:threo-3-hydroxy-L-aspartate ammonia-lyase